MLDVTWKLFSRTGNIEAYLLLKELEKEKNAKENRMTNRDSASSLHTEM